MEAASAEARLSAPAQPALSPAQRRWARHLAGVAVFLMLWEVAGKAFGAGLIAPPSEVLPEFVTMWGDGRLPGIVANSLQQMLAGYVLACGIGMPLGVAMGRFPVLGALVQPWLSMLIVTSVASLIPLFILAFGTGFEFRVLVVFASAVFYVTLVSYEGARELERRWVDVGRSFGANGLQRFRKIVLPALFPYLLTGARIGLGQSLRGMIVAELFVIVGIGGLIHNAGMEISTARYLALLVLLMAIALIANEILRWAGRRLAPWYEPSKRLG
jgi:ABC-type nitrate/sulfonate/bicarbonate transport system permease component